ncbi:MAG TPA: acetolactate decarboxylase [Humidesulfovibrio sp.]|uniref:acetolactate decarboxylase n=1 Tax=Humidesulfovibrio sp. TaxID=2910988 RepID=UPI002B8E207F|nr:acetolactate decarboxylase [Humidesulfovibrio sp.]HWR02482.1 acetolactate decarboxylase [Humidesulfovibrio sp.]
MRRTPSFFLAFSLILALGLCVQAPAAETATQPALVQVGVIDALLAGGYEGSLRLGTLRTLGDIGLGTFDALDGEMVVLDGVVHQVLASGKVARPADSLTTPFAQVARMPSPQALRLAPGLDLKAVEAVLDAQLADSNVFAAVRIEGRFASLTARSVPRQSPPYRTLAEVAKEQSVFPFADVDGTLIGLRGPAFAKGFGVPGWHWHFLTRDRTRGGHVLSFTLAPAANADVRLQPLRRLELILPERGLSAFDLSRDRSRELHAVEAGQ